MKPLLLNSAEIETLMRAFNLTRSELKRRLPFEEYPPMTQPVSNSVNTDNDFLIGSRGKILLSTFSIAPRTKQQAFRSAAWLKNLAEILPDEEVASTFEEIENAIRNT